MAGERTLKVGSSRLRIEDSDITAHYMTLGIMADVLYGLSNALWDATWLREAQIDIYSGPPGKHYHVGHGYLTNRGTPGAAAVSTA